MRALLPGEILGLVNPISPRRHPMLALNRLFVAMLEALAQTGTLLGAAPVKAWEPRRDLRERRVRIAGARGRR
jgi:hypothetical protein